MLANSGVYLPVPCITYEYTSQNKILQHYADCNDGNIFHIQDITDCQQHLVPYYPVTCCCIRYNTVCFQHAVVQGMYMFSGQRVRNDNRPLLHRTFEPTILWAPTLLQYVPTNNQMHSMHKMDSLVGAKRQTLVFFCEGPEGSIHDTHLSCADSSLSLVAITRKKLFHSRARTRVNPDK